MLSRWISADPFLEKYLPNLNDQRQREIDWDAERDLPGLGGVYNSANLGLYNYTHLNPIKYTDPDGKFVVKIPFTKIYFYAEFKARGGLVGVGFTTRQSLEKRHPLLKQLHPAMRERAEKVIVKLEAKGYDPIIKEALRTKEKQQEYYEKGVSKTLESKHLDQAGKGAAAIDVIDKIYQYNDSTKEAQAFFKTYGEYGQSLGLRWGGEFAPISKKTGYGWDPSHLEMKTSELKEISKQKKNENE